MPTLLPVLIVLLGLAGCASSWAESDRDEIERAVKNRDHTCQPEITHFTACPPTVAEMEEGECTLAFSAGASLDDENAIAYAVYRQPTGYLVGEKIPGGQDFGKEFFGITSGCPR